jgi:dihydropyrimidinase
MATFGSELSLLTAGLLRGKVVVEDGAFSGDLKDGQFLTRKVPEEIRTRPAV